MIGESRRLMKDGLVKYMLDEVKDEGMSQVLSVLEDWHGTLESICEIPKLVDDERVAAMLLLRRIEDTIKEVIHESERTLTTVTMTWLHDQSVVGGKRILFKSTRGSGVNEVRLEIALTHRQACSYSPIVYNMLLTDMTCDTVTFTHWGNRMDCLKD
jgi:hypothetical protein